MEQQNKEQARLATNLISKNRMHSTRAKNKALKKSLVALLQLDKVTDVGLLCIIHSLVHPFGEPGITDDELAHLKHLVRKHFELNTKKWSEEKVKEKSTQLLRVRSYSLVITKLASIIRLDDFDASVNRQNMWYDSQMHLITPTFIVREVLKLLEVANDSIVAGRPLIVSFATSKLNEDRILSPLKQTRSNATNSQTKSSPTKIEAMNEKNDENDENDVIMNENDENDDNFSGNNSRFSVTSRDMLLKMMANNENANSNNSNSNNSSNNNFLEHIF